MELCSTSMLDVIELPENAYGLAEKDFIEVLNDICEWLLVPFSDRHQVLLLILSEFEWVNSLLFPLKSSRFSDELGGSRS